MLLLLKLVQDNNCKHAVKLMKEWFKQQKLVEEAIAQIKLDRAPLGRTKEKDCVLESHQ